MCSQETRESLKQLSLSSIPVIKTVEEEMFVACCIYTFHWLPICQPINYKVSSISLLLLAGLSPQYLADILKMLDDSVPPLTDIGSVSKISSSFHSRSADRSFNTANYICVRVCLSVFVCLSGIFNFLLLLLLFLWHHTGSCVVSTTYECKLFVYLVVLILCCLLVAIVKCIGLFNTSR